MANRNVSDVIDKILEIIPSTEIILIDQLTEYNKSLWNQSPESLLSKENWVPFMNILNKNIPRINSDWKVKLVNIINNTEN
jgi:hypothetical protein